MTKAKEEVGAALISFEARQEVNSDWRLDHECTTKTVCGASITAGMWPSVDYNVRDNSTVL